MSYSRSLDAVKVRQLHEAGRVFSTGDSPLLRMLSPSPRWLLRKLNDRLEQGCVTVHLPNGRSMTLGGARPGPQAEVTLHNWRPLRRLITGGAVGWAQSFIEGDWDAADLTALFHLFSLNRDSLGRTTSGSAFSRWMNKLAHRVRRNSKAGSKRNISFHYDLGNHFYAQWLDPSMTYSSAIYEPGDNSLEAAQIRKYRRLLDLLDVKPGEHILEIGCGWGGFAELAARERGARVTGITLSQEQLDYARERITKAGLDHLVRFELRDYRDLDGEFDHVASIEMFEAVGEDYWPGFMAKLNAVLKPGGRAAMQVITIDEQAFQRYRRGADFIQTYIFPGGMLPPVNTFRQLAEGAGLLWDQAAMFGQHYAQTLKEWREAFDAACRDSRLPAAFDERFRRIWTYYLTYCEGGFLGGGIDVMQVCLVKPRGGA